MVATWLSMQAMQAISAKYWFFIFWPIHCLEVTEVYACLIKMWVCWPFIANRIKRPNEIASQRCDSILGFIVWVLEIWLSRILSLSKFVIIIITIFTFVIIIIIIVIIVNIAIINTIITIIIITIIIIIITVISCIIYLFISNWFSNLCPLRTNNNFLQGFSDHRSRKTFFSRIWNLIKKSFYLVYFISNYVVNLC